MSSKSKNSILQSIKVTKLRKSSTIASIQNDRRRSTFYLDDPPDLKISAILEKYTESHDGVPDIKIITQSDPFSNSVRKHKDDVNDLKVIMPAKYNTDEYNKPSVNCYGRNEIEGILRIQFKNAVHKHIVPVLSLVTSHFGNLLVVQLTYCGLQDNHISLLKTILIENKNIKSLCLEGNPLIIQTYYDLLQTQLTYLSLRSCQVNLQGIKNIAEALQDCDLITLNLSSNFIDDNCLKFLSKPLRFNRKLSSLNLADNWFTDVGLMDFMQVFQKFKLNHDEIVVRRRANLEYLREQQELIHNILRTTNYKQTTKSSIVSAKSLKPQSPRKNTNRSLSGRSEALTDSLQAKQIIAIKDKIELKKKKDNNPLIVECYPEDKSVYCRGNLTITNLNIAFNNIKAVSLKQLIDVLKYQNDFCNYNNCLAKVMFDDNLNNNYPLEFLLISELLQANRKAGRSKFSDRKIGSVMGMRSNPRL